MTKLRQPSTATRLAVVATAAGAAALGTIAVATAGDDQSGDEQGSYCAAQALDEGDPSLQPPMACFDTEAERDAYLQEQGVTFPPGYGTADD